MVCTRACIVRYATSQWLLNRLSDWVGNHVLWKCIYTAQKGCLANARVPFQTYRTLNSSDSSNYRKLLLTWKLVAWHRYLLSTSQPIKVLTLKPASTRLAYLQTTSPNMKHSAFLKIAILALVGMASSMSLIFFSAGDNCWTGVTDVRSVSPIHHALLTHTHSTSAATTSARINAATRPTRSA